MMFGPRIHHNAMSLVVNYIRGLFMPTLDSFIRNCIVMPRAGDGPLFEVHASDAGPITRVRLDGYAVVPIEVYESLLPKSGPTAPPESSAST
jgi:hypothetical protein